MFGIDDLAVGAALGFLRKYWVYIVIAVAVAVWHGVVYWAGGVGPRADLEKRNAEIAHAQEMAKLEGKVREHLRDEDVKRTDQELSDAKDRVNRAWEPLVQDLEKSAADADARRAAAEQRLRTLAAERPGEPVRRTAGEPDPGTGGQGLPDAVERYIAAERSRESRERADASRLLQAAQKQTDALINAQGFASRERSINAQ